MDASLSGVLILVGVGLWVMVVYQNNKARRMLEKWAAENGYQLTEMTRCGWNTGPFEAVSRRSPPVYKIALEHERGRVREAWAVCGEGGFRLDKLNPNPNLVVVVWDDEYKEGYSRRI